jgi:O-antigen/teichoic acid export membrane protein
MNKPDSNASRLIKHSTIYAIGNISRQLIGFVMLPVYTRYLSPADYGVIGLLTFAVSLLEGVFGARLGQAMPKFYFEREDPRGRNAVISTALMVTAGMSLIVTVAVVLARNSAAELLFGTASYGDVLGMFSLLLLTNALESQSVVYLQIQRLPKLFVAISLVRLAAQLFLNILFVVVLKLGVNGIALSSVTSGVAFAIGLSIYTFARTGLQLDLTLAKRMIQFSWPLWLAGIASLYISSAGRYYIRIFSSLSDVGLYELAAKFGAMLTLLVSQPFSRFWETERFNHYKKSNNAEIFRSVFQGYAALLALTVLGISLFAEPVIRVMAGPEFHDAYLAVPFLTLSALMRCLTDYCNFSFLVTGETGWISKNNYTTAAAVTVLYLLITPRFGFVGAAAALMLGELFQFLFIQHRARRHFDMQIRIAPLAAILALVTAAYITGDFLLRQSGLIADLAVKSVLYAVFAAALLVYLWRTAGPDSMLRNLAAPVLDKLPLAKLLFR